jgi:hypothetical protein
MFIDILTSIKGMDFLAQQREEHVAFWLLVFFICE